MPQINTARMRGSITDDEICYSYSSKVKGKTVTIVFNFARPLGIFHQEKIVFRLPSIIPYIARRPICTVSICKLAKDSVFLKYRSLSTTDIA